MQRIYADGHPDLGKSGFVPDTWAKPAKKMNHRSRSRIIELVNQIRSEADDHKQQPRGDKLGGAVRLFIVNRLKHISPLSVENSLRQNMAEISEDECWISEDSQGEGLVKTLILEHHMAAARMGFSKLFDPLYRVSSDTFRTNLLGGSLPGLRFFCVDVAELVDAVLGKDEFAIARIVQDKSPILDTQTFESAGSDQRELLKQAKSAVEDIRKLLESNDDPTLLELLNVITSNQLFQLPPSLVPFAGREVADSAGDRDSDTKDAKSEIVAWRAALDAPLSQALT